MNISKTLFKNLTRCNNFISLYDMYINRFLHEVKEIDGALIKSNESIDDIYLEDINEMEENIFSDEHEKVLEIFSGMFDDETGVDLTNITNAQMEAFSSIFTEVERLASIYISELLNKEVVASTDTYSQKKYSYKKDENTFYCYLDIYLEEEDTIKIFEVKATTSRKYDDMKVKISGESFSLFIKQNNGISKYVGQELIGMSVGKKVIEEKKILDKEKKFYDRFSKEGKYIYDLAVERHIVENSISQSKEEKCKNVEYYLVTLNAEYRFSGEYDENNKPVYKLDENGNALFKIYDMTDITKNYLQIIEQERDEILKKQEYLTINTHSLSKACDYKKTTQCKFCNICMKKALQEGSVLEYMGRQYAFSLPIEGSDKREYLTVYDMINMGNYKISDCLEYLTKPNNIMQYNCYVNNDTYIDKERIKLALEEIRYPIYHLDFESYNCPLPRFRGEKPYDQSLFQYSLHVEKEPGVCDLEKNHFEFLAKDHNDQRLSLVEQLISDIDLSSGGCVMVYNKSFEKTRLKELAGFYPKHKKALDYINDHIFDLLEVLNGSNTLYDHIMPASMKERLVDEPHFTYYNNELHGSFSIKKVLPIFTDLSYKNLVVKNGTEAIVTYGMLPYLTEKEYNEKYLALRVYCRQDTWAMVEILRGLRKMVKEKA